MYRSAPYFPEVSTRAPLPQSLLLPLPRKGKEPYRPFPSIMLKTTDILSPMTFNPTQTVLGLNECHEPSEPSTPIVFLKFPNSLRLSKLPHLPAIYLGWLT